MTAWTQFGKKLRLTQRGFTLIETLIIVVVLGVLTAIAAPSFFSLMDSIKIDQTIAEVRGTLQEGQRQAIRHSQPCILTMSLADKGNGNGKGNNNGNGYAHGHDNGKGNNDSSLPKITTQCPVTHPPEIQSGIDVASNISSTTGTASDVAIAFGMSGSAGFGVIGLTDSATTEPSDPSGKIVAYVADKQNVQKKCIAISATLGLTRVGNYTGETTPEDITASGVCTALDWTTQ